MGHFLGEFIASRDIDDSERNVSETASLEESEGALVDDYTFVGISQCCSRETPERSSSSGARDGRAFSSP